MRSNWRKQMMISALALTLSATNVAPVFASAAPDGKTNAADIAQTMGTTAQWNRWEKEWETLKNDWTQISLSPGSNATELNFAWYTPKQTNDDNSNAAVQAKVQAISPEQKKSNVPKLIIGEGRNMKNAKVYEAEQTAVKDEQDNNGETYNSNKVTATGLKENKTYKKQYFGLIDKIENKIDKFDYEFEKAKRKNDNDRADYYWDLIRNFIKILESE